MAGAERYSGEMTRSSGERTKRGHEPTPAGAGGPYICPVHPDVRQDQPGTCPKCGMRLEPERPGEPQRGEEHGSDHLKMLRDMRSMWCGRMPRS